MSNSRSRFFCTVTKRKQEDTTIQKDSVASDDDDDHDDAGTSLSRHIDSRSAAHLSIGNASNPLIIDEDSDSEIEVLPTQAGIKSSPTDREANDGKQGRDHVLHGKVRESHPALVASCLDQEPSIQDSIPNDQRKENPFSKFAFAGGTGGGFEIVSQPVVPPTFSWRSLNTPTASLRGDPTSNKNSVVSSSVVLEPPGLVISSNHGHPRKKKKTCEFIPMRSISKEEQDTITRKWHSMADPTAPLEVRRFQVLVAARLHARCQEPSVRKAMTVLREAFLPSQTTTNTTSEDGAGVLNVSTVARADPHVLALHLTNLQYYNIKAQHIVKAAQEIETEFQGVVPEDETSLLRLTGVGKVFADLLAFVNTREIHQRFMAVTPHDSSIAVDDTNRTP
jgi:endonuclease III